MPTFLSSKKLYARIFVITGCLFLICLAYGIGYTHGEATSTNRWSKQLYHATTTQLKESTWSVVNQEDDVLQLSCGSVKILFQPSKYSLSSNVMEKIEDSIYQNGLLVYPQKISVKEKQKIIVGELIYKGQFIDDELFKDGIYKIKTEVSRSAIADPKK